MSHIQSTKNELGYNVPATFYVLPAARMCKIHIGK